MDIETSFTYACANLAALCDEVTATREPIVIHRRGSEDVALVAAAELTSLMETAHHLRSPRNAQRLLNTFVRAHTQVFAESTVEAMRREFDLGQAP